MRSINVHHWIKIWSDRNLKTGRFDSLSVRWNYKTLVAALIHIFWPKSSCSSLGLRNDCDTPNKSWPGVSSEWLKITRKDKNLKQTFRLLEEVVRETKAQSVSFLTESGNAILSYERNKWLWLKRIPLSSIEGRRVDIRDWTIRITNLE